MFVLENPSGTESSKEKYLRQSRARSYAALNIHKKRRAGQKAVPFIPVETESPAYDPNQPTFATRPAPGQSSKKASGRQHQFESVFRSRKPQNSGASQRKQADTQKPPDLSTSTSRCRLESSPFSISVPTPVTNLANTTHAESRSLAFFREKTALEWPGWCDAEFWRVLAPQACYAYPTVKHAIASIGAYHEGLTTDVEDEDAFDRHKEFAFNQSKKALACLSRDYDAMPISAILVAYTAIAAASTYMHDSLYWQAIRMQCNIIDSIRANQTNLSQPEKLYITQYLEPIIERQRAKAGQYIDLLYCLKLTPAMHFYISTPVVIPERFQSLYQAESILESFLHYTTYFTKLLHLPPLSIPNECEDLHNAWLHALDVFRSTFSERTPEYISVSILRSCGNLGVMMIKTMHAPESDESIFDTFTDYFAELRDTNRELLSLFSPTPGRAHVRFGVDVSWITLIGNAASRWCRDPQIRSELINMLRMCRRHEAIEAAFIWGEVAIHAKSLEERYLTIPPRSCHDIPAKHRVRVNLTSFLWTEHKRVQRIQYHFHPYEDTDYRDFCVLHSLGRETDTSDYPAETELLKMPTDLMTGDDVPQMVMGRGFTSWLKPNSKDEYHTIKDPNFFFPISRT